MAIEPKRGCGYRKKGGLYMVGGSSGVDCHRLPIPLHVCPVCNNGIKYSRGFTWINPYRLLGKCHEQSNSSDCHKIKCNSCDPPDEKHGLLWIGKKFYTPQSFVEESNSLGISKRIAAVPHNFEVGKSIIYLAHLEACEQSNPEPTEMGMDVDQLKKSPGIFMVFIPTKIEKIVGEKEATDEEIKKLEKQGITPVIVPDDDKDHAGTVYDE